MDCSFVRSVHHLFLSQRYLPKVLATRYLRCPEGFCSWPQVTIAIGWVPYTTQFVRSSFQYKAMESVTVSLDTGQRDDRQAKWQSSTASNQGSFQHHGQAQGSVDWWCW